MIESIFTIGAFNHSMEEFFRLIGDNEIDLFCDLRARRGVRGAKFKHVNSNRLQDTLSSMGVSYLHFKQLAPTQEIRAIQHTSDDLRSTGKRDRTILSPAFIDGYDRHILSPVSCADITHQMPETTKRPVLFCVEGPHTACHRSLAASWLSKYLGVPVVHL